jgi:radical SAM-linked protein
MTGVETEPWARARLRFGKRGPLRFLGQLDLNRTFDRVLRRTGLPFRYSEGFNPRIRLSFPCASPVGMESSAELLEVQIARPLDTAAIGAALAADLPPDLPVFEVIEVPTGERLRLVHARYSVRAVEGRLPDLGAELERLLTMDALPARRRGKEIDLRPFLEALEACGDGSLRMSLRFLETGATIRPEDVLGALTWEEVPVRVERIGVRVSLRIGAATREMDHGA